jgi:hypothetical protein
MIAGKRVMSGESVNGFEIPSEIGRTNSAKETGAMTADQDYGRSFSLLDFVTMFLEFKFCLFIYRKF